MSMKKSIAVLIALAIVVASGFAAGTATTVKEAATITTVAPAAMTATPAATELQLSGVIQKVIKADKTKNTTEQIVVLSDKKEYTIMIVATTQIKNSKGTVVKFAALAKGGKVAVTYKTTSAGNEAVSVTETK